MITTRCVTPSQPMATSFMKKAGRPDLFKLSTWWIVFHFESFTEHCSTHITIATICTNTTRRKDIGPVMCTDNTPRLHRRHASVKWEIFQCDTLLMFSRAHMFSPLPPPLPLPLKCAILLKCQVNDIRVVMPLNNHHPTSLCCNNTLIYT